MNIANHVQQTEGPMGKRLTELAIVNSLFKAMFSHTDKIPDYYNIYICNLRLASFIYDRFRHCSREICQRISLAKKEIL